METTTIPGFWGDFASTTGNILSDNIGFFQLVFFTALAVMLLGGLIYTMTIVMKRFNKKKRKW